MTKKQLKTLFTLKCSINMHLSSMALKLLGTELARHVAEDVEKIIFWSPQCTMDQEVSWMEDY